MTDLEAAWFAGIVDGEGHLGVARMTREGDRILYSIRLAIVNTDPRIIRECTRTTGIGYVTTKDQTKRPDRWRPSYTWEARSTGAHLLLERIRPYLISKGEQADLLREAYECMTARPWGTRSRSDATLDGIHRLVSTTNKSLKVWS